MAVDPESGRDPSGGSQGLEGLLVRQPRPPQAARSPAAPPTRWSELAPPPPPPAQRSKSPGSPGGRAGGGLRGGGLRAQPARGPEPEPEPEPVPVPEPERTPRSPQPRLPRRPARAPPKSLPPHARPRLTKVPPRSQRPHGGPAPSPSRGPRPPAEAPPRRWRRRERVRGERSRFGTLLRTPPAHALALCPQFLHLQNGCGRTLQGHGELSVRSDAPLCSHVLNTLIYRFNPPTRVGSKPRRISGPQTCLACPRPPTT